MTAKNPEWYNKLVPGSMDKHKIYGDLVHKYVSASMYTAITDSTKSAVILVKGLYKAPSTGTPKYEELAATAEEVYGDFISGTMLICENDEDAPAFYKPTSMAFDLTKADENGHSPIVITYGKVKSVTATNGAENLLEVIECHTKELYTAS